MNLVIPLDRIPENGFTKYSNEWVKMMMTTNMLLKHFKNLNCIENLIKTPIKLAYWKYYLKSVY